MVEAIQAAGYICGPNANYLIESWFGDCVYSSLEIFAFCIGLSSVFFWLIAQLPQFINNILRQSAEALSPWFLIQWLAGDSCNLLGCVFTGDQLATQTITAGYFIFADFIILTQYFYYQHRNRKTLLGVYYSDSDESVHKQSNGYNRVTNTSEYLELDKLDEQSALAKISRANTSGIRVKSWTNETCPECQLYTCSAKSDLCTYYAIPQCKLIDKGILTKFCLPDSEVEDERRVEAKSPSDLNRADRDKACHLQQILYPFSVSDLRHQDSWMHEHSQRLRKLVQEYGLEYGQETISQHKLLYTQVHKKTYVHQPIHFRSKSCHLPGPSRKARFKALLGVACLFGLASSNWYMAPNSSHTMDHNFGSVLGRRTLLAVPDTAALSFEENLSELSTIVGLNLSSATQARIQFSFGSHPALFWTKLIGRSLGWVSSVFYLGSRISQIVKNKQRRSADGLSLGMFACAVLGNLTYGGSVIILANSWGSLIGKAPWLLGSLGTVFLDFSIFIQAHYYRWHLKKSVPIECTPLLV